MPISEPIARRATAEPARPSRSESGLGHYRLMRGSYATSAPDGVLALPWRKRVVVALALAGVFLGLFVGLPYSPRPVQDEGAIMLVARTLAEDGVVATRTSEGYETFGAVQSVGPTIFGPIALSFWLFGPGITQARAVVAGFSALTALGFLCLGWRLFGWRAGLLGLGFLVASPTVSFVLHGRQALGEVPALGFLVAGALIWARGEPRGTRGWSVLTGLLFGAAMVTKPHFVVMIAAALTACVCLDLVYLRQRRWRAIATIGAIACACAAGWYVWQMAYFGRDVYAQNAAKLRELGALSYGVEPRVMVESAKLLFGTGSDHLYFFAGPVALLYAGVTSVLRAPKSNVVAFLLAFTVIWMTAFLLFMPPVPRFVLTPIAVVALFVGKLWDDLIAALSAQARGGDKQSGVPVLAAAVGSIVLVMLAYGVPRATRPAVSGGSADLFELAGFLERDVPLTEIIETWEREVGVLTSHVYHYPDQVMLGRTNAAIYRGGARDYSLGDSYFNSHRPAYVIVGWYARFSGVYDDDYLSRHAYRVASIGEAEFRYDVIKLCGSSPDPRCPH
jgi:hypothetical protein